MKLGAAELSFDYDHSFSAANTLEGYERLLGRHAQRPVPVHPLRRDRTPVGNLCPAAGGPALAPDHPWLRRHPARRDLQPPKPEIIPSARILQLAAEHDTEPDREAAD